ncbi:MAG TPA: sigma-70 family RNA polymerase sigma factor [Fluviicola sp.]|nr:sigma-70 family RNA polymerase sigma factor [Fluviicola sp.]
MGIFHKHIAQYTDEELMKEVIRNHSSLAITELHRRYSRKLLGYFIKMLQRDEDTANDFVQELFLRILEKKHLYDPEKRFYTWLFTIASNMCKTAYRRSPIVALSHDAHELQRHTVHGDDLAEKNRFKALLKESLDQLEHHHKTVFVLRYMEQFSLNEIADITETSLGTVKSRLFYATKKMTEHLKAFDPTYESTFFKLN